MFTNFIEKWPTYCKYQVINNLVKEWKKFASKILPTKIFIANNLPINTANEINNEMIIDKSLEFYEKNLQKWINFKSSFGILYYYHNNCKFNDLTNEQPYLNDVRLQNHISFVLFCSKSEQLKMQQMLTRTRLHWYRKLSKSPMKSGFQTTLNEEANRLQIIYEPKQYPFIDNHQITLDRIQFNCENRSKDDNVNNSIIHCYTNLNNCLLAFLNDGFTILNQSDNDDNNDHQKRIVMKLNQLLVPYNLALIFDTKNCQKEITQRKLLEVANYLINLLDEYSNISIFPFNNDPTMFDNNITIDRCDELAIKYCIILNEETLRNGIIHLRNRDTTISEQIHISNLLKTILFYLQTEKLITFTDDK